MPRQVDSASPVSLGWAVTGGQGGGYLRLKLSLRLLGHPCLFIGQEEGGPVKHGSLKEAAVMLVGTQGQSVQTP